MAQNVFSAFLWRATERFGSHLITFAVTTLLARILEPAAYGTIALINVFINLADVFIYSGMGVALVQKKNADETDFSSLFYCNMAICLVAYLAMFLGAPCIAAFYQTPALTLITRIMAINLIFAGFKSIQQAYVSRHLLFRLFFWANFSANFIAGVIAIWMAYRGYGVYALVQQILTHNFLCCVILAVLTRWRPRLLFSLERLEGLFNYGWKIFAARIIARCYRELTVLMIGKFYSKDDLAFYHKGKNFPSLFSDNIALSIDSVLFPVLSKVQDSVEQIREITRKAMKTSTFVMMPLMAGLAATAEPLLRLLLTEKWLPCVLFLRITCFHYAFHPVSTANLNAIKALGRSDLFLKIEIAKHLIAFALLFATITISVKAVAYSTMASSLVFQLINSWPNRKLLDYRYEQQILDILPQILLSAVMGIVVYLLTFLGLRDFHTLLLQCCVGMVFYLGGAWLLKIDCFFWLLNNCRRLLKI